MRGSRLKVMPIGETICDQLRRGQLNQRAQLCLQLLDKKLGNDSACGPLLSVLNPGLAARLSRACRLRNLRNRDLMRLLRAKYSEASRMALARLAWLTQELELSVALDADLLIGYLMEEPALNPHEKGALLYCSAVNTPENSETVHLLHEYIRSPSRGLRSATPDVFMTAQQKLALQRMVELAETYYEGEQSGPVRARLFPLLTGPTGVGKNHLVKALATQLRAAYVVFTLGDWIPLGASSEYESTLYSILTSVANNDRVVLCLDEIDKVRLEVDSTWGRSVTGDLWRVLDFNFPINPFLRSNAATHASVSLSETQLSGKLRETLFIVGAGTWQDVVEQKRVHGLMTGSPPPVLNATTIRGSRTIPTELLLRFHPATIQLSYPTPEETAAIYDASGLKSAAQEVGLPLDATRHDWTLGGMRSIEALWAEVSIRRRRKKYNL